MQTLVLNWPFDSHSDDSPCWTHHEGLPERQGHMGVMTGFTWSWRQFAIDVDSLRSGHCFLCGEYSKAIAPTLREAYMQPNDKSTITKLWRDPHVAYTAQGPNVRAEDTEKNHPSREGQWRNWLVSIIGPDTEPSQAPRALVEAASRVGETDLRVMACGFAMRSEDKTIECLEWDCTIPTRMVVDKGGKDTAAKIKEFDAAIEQSIDPRLASWKQPVGKLKHAKVLKMLRSHDGRKLHALRASLAARLPALEYGIQRNLKHSRPVSEDNPVNLKDVKRQVSMILEGGVRSVTAGSPFHRRMTLQRARRALETLLKSHTLTGKHEEMRKMKRERKTDEDETR